MKTMKKMKWAFVGLALSVGANASFASEWCDSGKTIKFAGLNWESGMLLSAVMQDILKEGYGCKVDSLPGNSIAMENALSTNDIQVFSEEWVGRSRVWNRAAAAGKVIGVGSPVKGAVEGWYVPRYVVEGDASRGIKASAPDLKNIADLAKYASVFRDQEEPSKGRFYNCPAGWTCETENTKMLKDYGLSASYTNFRSGTGPALDAAVLSSYKRKQPILFYYWSPTALLGRIDVIKLAEKPGVDKSISIKVGLSKTFHDEAPELVDVLSKVNIPIELLNSYLAQMTTTHIKAPALAKVFLKEKPELWTKWVSASAAEKIQNSL
ncbi:ABC transporter substrate-binding protein [Marinomonas arenicola]